MSEFRPLLRAYRPETDTAYVVSSWLRSYADAREIRDYLRAVHNGRKEPFYDAYRPTVEALIARSQVLIACLPEHSDAIVGYAVLEEPRFLHWAYTKSAFRRLGVARFLLGDFAALPLIVSHPSPLVRLPPNWSYQSRHRWKVPVNAYEVDRPNP